MEGTLNLLMKWTDKTSNLPKKPIYNLENLYVNAFLGMSKLRTWPTLIIAIP